jgi:hypothetical protein
MSLSSSSPSFVPKLSQSKSKADFFKQLGWKENDEAYTRLYQMMMVRCSYLKVVAVSEVDDVDRKRLLPEGQGRFKTVRT